MKFYPFPHFSVARHSPQSMAQRECFRDAFSLFGLLPNFIPVEDIAHVVPDPPDLVIHTQGRRIGVEVTKVFPEPKTGKRKGYRQAAKHRQWQAMNDKQRPAEAEFVWPAHSLAEKLSGIATAIDTKAPRASAYHGNFDEVWLCLSCGHGSGMTAFAEDAGFLKAHNDAMGLTIVGLFLHEMASLCRRALPFTKVLLLGEYLLSFVVRESPYVLPEPDEALLALGAAADKALLRATSQARSIMRYSNSFPSGA